MPLSPAGMPIFLHYSVILRRPSPPCQSMMLSVSRAIIYRRRRAADYSRAG
jgi:hypothetical protein